MLCTALLDMTEKKITSTLMRVDMFAIGTESDIAVRRTVISSMSHLPFSSNYLA